MHWPLVLLWTGVACALFGGLSLLLAISPDFASPIYLPAGIALAAVLTFGPRAAIGVALGALLVELAVAVARARFGVLPFLLVPAGLALGAAVQALVGAALVRRFVPQPATLAEPRDVALFYLLGAPVACVVSASVATTLTFGLSGTVEPSALAVTWLTWWTGDSLGVLIGAPITLTLIGRPRADWAPRRRSVALPLVITTLALGLAILQVAEWDRQRALSAFDREADTATLALSAQLSDASNALEAMHGLFIASDEVTLADMHRASVAWLGPASTLASIAWFESVPRDGVAAFEARARADGLAGYRVYDRPDAGGAGLDPAAAVLAMRYVEQLSPNVAALGVNAWSVPAVRAAIEATQTTDQPTATAGFRLTQDSGARTAVALYRGVYEGTPDTPEQRRLGTRGVLSVAFRVDEMLKGPAAQIPPHLQLCLIDADAGPGQRRLAGSPGCEAAPPAPLEQTNALSFGGRRWLLKVGSPTLRSTRFSDANVWLFSLVGLLGTSMLGTLLLTVSGRTQRIETAVRERTAALEAEVREREVAEAALRESEQRFRNILNNVPIGVIYTDLRGDLIQANPRFCDLLQYGEEDLLLMSSSEYTHPDDVAQDDALTLQLMRGEIPMYRREKRYLTSDRRVLWVQVTVSLLRDAQGQPRRIVGVVEDITEHLLLKEAEQAREVAERSNLAKSEFLSRMSHELRTPLNAMLGFAQLLELDPRHPLADAQKPWVAQIQQAGWHLLEMINDVLDLSRIESGNLKLKLERLNLHELLAATLPMVQSDAMRRRITISTELGEGAASVLGDATRVKQILTNLLSNAVKYNKEAGRIHVASRARANETVEIVVTDSGLGMTAQQIGELFQPFNRLGRERMSQQGTGIGLVISLRLAELMGGSLRASSASGEGSAFVLTLPRPVDIDTVPSELRALEQPEAQYHQRRVHYIEDNETNVEVMRGILSQRAQVALGVSMTGLDGLAAIRQQEPDVILLDMHLPDISGLELLRHLKADASLMHIPVVVVSADALPIQIDAAFEAGAAHYITKPVSVTELLAVLDRLLEKIDTELG